jgi:hypothetical protein
MPRIAHLTLLLFIFVAIFDALFVLAEVDDCFALVIMVVLILLLCGDRLLGGLENDVVLEVNSKSSRKKKRYFGAISFRNIGRGVGLLQVG